MRTLLLTLVLLVSVGCASLNKALTVSAATLDGAYKQYKSAATVFATGCNQAPRTIKDQTCEDFKTFQGKFERLFPQAVQLWKIAAASQNKAGMVAQEALIQELITELTDLVARVVADLRRN